jgi:hypothetical protein
MSKRAAINAMWHLTVFSFVFVQIVGVIVVVSVLVAEDQASGIRVIGVYMLFLLFGGFLFFALWRIKKR